MNKETTMKTTVTAKDFDDVLDAFLLELQTADAGRAIEIEEVMNTLLEEKEARGL